MTLGTAAGDAAGPSSSRGRAAGDSDTPMRQVLPALSAVIVATACAAPVVTPEAGPTAGAARAGLSVHKDADVTAIADGTFLFRGGFVPGRQPDGNSVVIDAPGGLVVFDTGRHRAHAQRLLDFARETGKPVAAIVNSHWHLDHGSGNRWLRAAHPQARLLATTAAEGALAGFLADSRKQAEALIAKGAIPEPQLSDVRGDLATIAQGHTLLPDDAVQSSGERSIAGRRFHAGVAAHAVTAADLWLYDPATRVLLAGDLVTLPAPLFDTACPAGWRRALEALEHVDFALLVPGHGAPMDRAGFARYRAAFDGLLACAGGESSTETCSDRWLRDTGDLVPAAQEAQARRLLDYYLEQVLRDPARRGRDCPA